VQRLTGVAIRRCCLHYSAPCPRSPLVCGPWLSRWGPTPRRPGRGASAGSFETAVGRCRAPASIRDPYASPARRPPCGMRLMHQPEVAAPNFWGRIMIRVCFGAASAASGGPTRSPRAAVGYAPASAGSDLPVALLLAHLAAGSACAWPGLRCGLVPPAGPPRNGRFAAVRCSLSRSRGS
jgi:hypothetical protein